MCALSPTISSFLEVILPLNFPSMRIVSSNSSSPLKEEPRSRKPLRSPDLFFTGLSPSAHQFIDEPNQFIFAGVAHVDHAAAPFSIDLNFASQSSLQSLFRVAGEYVLFLFRLGRRFGR